MCFKENDNFIRIETPNKKTKLYYKYLEEQIPPEILDTQKLLQEMLLV